MDDTIKIVSRNNFKVKNCFDLK